MARSDGEALTGSNENQHGNTEIGLAPQVLFWVMLAIVVVPFLIFLYTSYDRLGKTLEHIGSRLESEAVSLLNNTKDAYDDRARRAFLARARVALERDVVVHRHHRASTLLAVRTWMRFMSLIFGTMLVVTGAVFVLCRITAPRSSGQVLWQELRVSVESSSPGLLLIALGCVLIAIPNLAGQTIKINDTSSYVLKGEIPVIGEGLPDPPLNPPQQP